jgi:CRP-like cAMP-binding protein
MSLPHVKERSLVVTHANLLLSRLPINEFMRVEPHLTAIHMDHGAVLAETHRKISRAYFPHGGVLSFVVDLPGGGVVETGVVGRDGVFGTNQALDDRVSLNRVTVQVPSEASVIEVSKLRSLLLELSELRKTLCGFEQFLFAQAQQTAACNALHQIRERACKWFSRMSELAGDELPLTQEFLAQMMGVRRTSVNAAAQELSKLGIIEYQRGKVRIKDKEKLHALSCSCHEDLKDHYRRIFEPHLYEAET